MIQNTIHQYLNFTVFVMFAFIGIQQLVLRQKLQLNYFLAGLFLAGSYNMLYFWFYGMGLIARFPALLNTEISAAFLIGPCLFLYFSVLLGDEVITKKAIFFHGLPFVSSLLIIIFINISVDSITGQFESYTSHMPEYSHNKVIFIINTLCNLSITGYFFTAAIKTIFFLKNQSVTKEIKIILFFLITFSFSAALLMGASFIQNPILLQISIVFLSLLPIGFIFFSFRNPDYAIRVIQETRQIRIRKTKNLPNIKEVKETLNRIMIESKVYRDQNITLEALSNQLSMTPHDLSYILNNEINKNFNSYINSFRITEAKSLIRADKGKNITNIAFEVGFNSKSSFYRCFIKETGISPKKFEQAAGKSIR